MQASRRRKKPKRTTAVLQFLMWVQLRHCGKAASGSTESAEGVTMNIRRLVAIVFVGMFSAALLCAQDTASLSGTVTDSSGTAVANAQVTVDNAERGIHRVVTTNQD